MSDNDTPTPKAVALSVLTPEQILYDGEALWVEVPLTDGLIGVWPGHAPLMGALGQGVVRFETHSGVREVPVSGGVLRVGVERCAVLLASEIEMDFDVARGRSAQLHESDRLGDEMVDAIGEAFDEEQLDALQEAS
jgi:F-type H+-transporting ATPase subunit epsilon